MATRADRGGYVVEMPSGESKSFLTWRETHAFIASLTGGTPHSRPMLFRPVELRVKGGVARMSIATLRPGVQGDYRITRLHGAG